MVTKLEIPYLLKNTMHYKNIINDGINKIIVYLTINNELKCFVVHGKYGGTLILLQLCMLG